MNQQLSFQRLDIYVVTKELAARVHQAKIADAELRDQATRASKSTFLNTSEGLPSRSPAKRRYHFGIANGSLHEALAAIDLAAAIGALPEQAARDMQRLGVRAKLMLGALLR